MAFTTTPKMSAPPDVILSKKKKRGRRIYKSTNYGRFKLMKPGRNLLLYTQQNLSLGLEIRFFLNYEDYELGLEIMFFLNYKLMSLVKFASSQHKQSVVLYVFT